MIDFPELKNYSISVEEQWSCFGSPQTFSKLPQIHQEQIFFLHRNASDFILEFLRNSKMVNGYGQSEYHPLSWQPFPQGYFKSMKKIIRLYNEKEVKKWLFNCNIPFRNEVFLVSDSENVILTSWKIIVKYSNLIFSDDYAIVFDESVNWCLYIGNGYIYFGENSMFYQSLKARSFKVLESFYISKIGLLVIIDSDNYILKENDILYVNPGMLEWIVINEYAVNDAPSTLFLLANDQFKKGNNVYLLLPLNGNHKPAANEILFLKD